MCQKDYVWNPANCNGENGKYLASIMDDSVIICDEVIKSYDEQIKFIPENFNEKKLWNTKFLHFTCLFINHHHIIDSC